MNTIDKARLLLHILRWRLTWSRRDIDYRDPTLDPAKFITARAAAELIRDGAVVLSCGMAGNARCSIFFWAIRDRFQKEAHPQRLTWMNVGAQGGRGRVPGTVEELALPGLLNHYITGHLETAKALLKLAGAAQVELHTLPQGQMSLLLAAQGRGELTTHSIAGVGTFLDPRVGRGSAVTPGTQNHYVDADGGHLTYRLPKVEVALYNAPYADLEGNIYFKHAATITENVQGSQAARRNGGIVMATVARDRAERAGGDQCTAEQVDYIVVNPLTEQTASVPQRRFWPTFTVGGNVDEIDAIERLKFANNVLRITPVRGPVANALARLATTLFVRVAPKGGIANIGVGYPEEVCRLVIQHGLSRNYTFTTETGVYGGLPAPGVFFGAAINPQRMEPSSWMFEFYQNSLDVALLGFLEVDAHGNVNASKRGARMSDYVGPGGFPDIASGARIVICVGSWMAHAKLSIRAGKLQIVQPGKPKFVEQVDEITFSGAEAIRRGKEVYYVTNVGVFRLTERGLELQEVMPGVDVQRDIVDSCAAHIVLPAGKAVPVAAAPIVTGAGYTLVANEERQ